MNTIWEKVETVFKGTIFLQILYFLIRSITLSTCIRNFAMIRVCASSCGDKLILFPRKGGMTISAPFSNNISRTLNPRSTITRSPGLILSMILLFLKSSLSEIAPSYTSETNDIAPDGVIPISTLQVQ